MAKDKGGITFDVLYKQWIDQIKDATTKEDLIIDSEAMRDKAENEYIGLLRLEGDYLTAWNSYYIVQKAKRQRGEKIDKTKGEVGEASLDRNNEAVVNKGLLTIKQMRALKLALIKDMNAKGADINPKSVEIGHMDHGVAMDKARILWDNAKVVEKIGDVGITREQKAFIGKALLAQQAIERAKHSDIVRIKKKLGAKTVDDNVLIAYLTELNEKINLNATFLMQTGASGPKLKYDLEFEAKDSNQESGALTGALGTRMADMLRAVDKKTMQEFKDSDFAWALMNVPGSWTYLKRVGDFFSNLIKGKRAKVPDSKHKKSTTIINKAKSRLKAEVAKVKKLRRATLAKIRRSTVEEPKQLVGLFNVMGLINLVLAREVQAQMGKSSDPPTRLRYQDGDFANSAKLLNLVHTKKDTIAGIYEYMYYPYDVFLPGHPLDNGLRNPRTYIEHGIRAAARTILEGRFPGIVLEPSKF